MKMNSFVFGPLSQGTRLLAALALLSGLGLARAAEDPFDDIIRKTDALTPEQEQKQFHLPPGFIIELVASEPDIGKPMNMAFDARGRLWITQSREYPFPVAVGTKGRDAIKILADIDDHGKAGRVTTFETGLNIPIGLYPYKAGAIGFSIPFIHYFQDTDKDGRADKDDVLYGRFGFDRDTHGLTSSFRRGFDGWIYADHGFNNNSTIVGADGSSITMNSGNCYRFKTDGSHVEQYSWGQVNPFGLMFDPLGDLFSADCHSAPVYQLLRGAYYPSFGKPHDGLGFGPAIIDHSHGSTAISGMVFYAADNFPTEFRGNTFIGNVMTSRINRDSLQEHGSTRVTKEEPDFLSSDDPWFRPVDLQLGPDGAIYVADFYNRIIGHYEVPLDHPGRDRERGRIWRISYKGDKPGGPAGPIHFDLSKSSVAEAIKQMGHTNITRRMLAMNYLVDQVGAPAVAPVKKLMRSGGTPLQKMHGIWVLRRLDALDDELLTAAAKDADRGVRTHAMRVLADLPAWNPAQQKMALAGLHDGDAYVRRSAADALGLHPAFEQIRPLLDLRQHASADDLQLVHVTRMALRDQLKPAGNLSRLPLSSLSEADARAIADVAIGAPTPEAGAYLLAYVRKYDERADRTADYLRHAARYASDGDMDALAQFARTKFAADVDFQLALLKSVQQGTEQRGATAGPGIHSWAAALARQLLDAVDESTWVNYPIPGMKDVTNPWFLQKRNSADGDKESMFLCSLPPGGERLTGVLRSKSFAVPAKLSFFLAGHDGAPDQPAKKKNFVRLVAADSGETLAQAAPPRNDLAQAFSWDLSAHAGKQAYLEVVDGDTGTAYAWLAIGRIEPAVVALPQISPSQAAQHQQAAADLVRALSLANLAPALTRMLGAPSTDLATRAVVARALVSLNPNENLSALAPLTGDGSVPASLREGVTRAVARRDAAGSKDLLVEAMRTASFRVQVTLAQALAGSSVGAESLLGLIEAGQATPRLLIDRSVKAKLEAAKPARGAERITKLTAGLPPVNDGIQKLIDQRRDGYAAAKAKAADGERIFTQTCTVCHSIDGHGGVVGPQLDGVGNRGLERLIEDVLDPNRNVDRAFHVHFITLKDGEVVSGLPRREEGAMVVLADGTGKEISIAKKDIQERRESESSLMPDNFGEALPVADFYNLMAFLLSKGTHQAAH